MKKFFFILSLFIFINGSVDAATIGTINTTNKYAKIYAGPYAGTQINFRPNDTASVQGIEVHADRIRGYAWGEATGWIVFSCEDTTNACTDGEFKVTNDGSGHLAGYAWGESTGWISFSCSNSTSSCSTGAGSWGVSIENGNFNGYAWSQNFGYIQFNCNVSGACVSTDWATASNSSGGGVVPVEILQIMSDKIRQDENNLLLQNKIIPSIIKTVIPTKPVPTIKPFPSIKPVVKPFVPNTTVINNKPIINPPVEEILDETIVENNIAEISKNQNLNKNIKSNDNFFQKIIQKFDSFINKLGDTTAGVIPIVGAVAGLIAVMSGLFFVQAITLGEAALLPLKIMSGALLFFGTIRRPWGTVFDSLNKHPLDPSRLSLVNVVTGKVVASILTDINGRYSFKNVLPGRYKIFITKDHYTFPSIYLKEKIGDGIYDNLYYGEEFVISTNGQVINKNIPLDRVGINLDNLNSKENIKVNDLIIENHWHRIYNFVFSVGFVSSILITWAMPNKVNKILLAIYIVLGILLYIIRTPKLHVKLSQTNALVIDSKNQKPIPFALVEIKNSLTLLTVAKRITNQDGMFYALVDKGTYKIEISKPDALGGYAKVFESPSTSVQKGFKGSIFKV